MRKKGPFVEANVSNMGPSLAPKGAHRDRKGAQKALILGMGGGGKGPERARHPVPGSGYLELRRTTREMAHKSFPKTAAKSTLTQLQKVKVSTACFVNGVSDFTSPWREVIVVS